MLAIFQKHKSVLSIMKKAIFVIDILLNNCFNYFSTSYNIAEYNFHKLAKHILY